MVVLVQKRSSVEEA